MRCWLLAPTLVFLMLLLISAGSSQIWANGSKSGLQELKRQRSQTGGSHERLHVSRQKRTAQMLCRSEEVASPPGCSKEDPGCSCVCRSGLYRSNQECLLCNACENNKVEVKKCTANSDTECGCEPGQYKDCNLNWIHPCNDYFCFPCTSCLSKNKTTQKNCSEWEDAVCGDCLPGYHLNANDACLQPPQSNQNPEIVLCSQQSCSPGAPGFRVEYMILCIICPLCIICLLLLGVLVIYCKRRRAKKPPTAGSLLSLPQPGFPMRRTPLCYSSPLQGRQLYTIIDVVPVRRWKEFVRSLGLRDGEIEAVELEHRQLREQQYEMLKCWQHKRGTTVETIFAVLEEMELEGCAQELRQLLQPNNLLPIL